MIVTQQQFDAIWDRIIAKASRQSQTSELFAYSLRTDTLTWELTKGQVRFQAAYVVNSAVTSCKAFQRMRIFVETNPVIRVWEAQKRLSHTIENGAVWNRGTSAWEVTLDTDGKSFELFPKSWRKQLKGNETSLKQDHSIHASEGKTGVKR